MTTIRVVLPFGLPGLNEILAAKGNTFITRGSKRRSAYTTLKKKYTSLVAKELVAQGCVPDEPHSMIEPTFMWFEPHKRRDLDNISAGGVKFVMDAFVEVGIIPSDNLMHVQRMTSIYQASETRERHALVTWDVVE